MWDPKRAVLEWWKLVKPGGHLFIIVPDEDLYEQGVFPSRFNNDHKATFTIFKPRSWSPVSINVLDLVSTLPHGTLVQVALQDWNYDRRLLTHGLALGRTGFFYFCLRLARWAAKKWSRSFAGLEALWARYHPVDQTMRPDTLAQIQCIVRKSR
jgi:hypothetical protein